MVDVCADCGEAYDDPVMHTCDWESPPVPSPEDTVEPPVPLCTQEACPTRRFGAHFHTAGSTKLWDGPTPPAARTGEDDEADVEARAAVVIERTLRGRFPTHLIGTTGATLSHLSALAVLRELRHSGFTVALTARPLVSGTCRCRHPQDEHAPAGPPDYEVCSGYRPGDDCACTKYRPLVSGTVMCCTLGHENVPAVALGTYDDGDAVATNVAYCDPCALAVAGSYRVTQMLDARPLVSGTAAAYERAAALVESVPTMGSDGLLLAKIAARIRALPAELVSGTANRDDDSVTVRLPAEDVAFIRGFDPDRDRTASRADMVRVVEHLQAALTATDPNGDPT